MEEELHFVVVGYCHIKSVFSGWDVSCAADILYSGMLSTWRMRQSSPLIVTTKVFERNHQKVSSLDFVRNVQENLIGCFAKADQ